MIETTRISSRGAMLALCTAVVAASLAPAQAAQIYGNFAGSTLMYTNVTESSPSGDATPLFGEPVVVGNSLKFFQPGVSIPSLGFGATAAGGSADVTDGFLSFGVMANPGTGIGAISFSEGGDYAMTGLAGTPAQVSARLPIFEIYVTEVDGAPITPFTLSSNPIPIVTYTYPIDPPAGFWSLADSFDLNAELASRGIPYSLGVSKFTVKLDNTLTAISLPGSVAFIDKKKFQIDIDPQVPEPSTAVLAAVSASIALVASRRRA